MALFKLTTKKSFVSSGKRIDTGMTAEVSHNGSFLPWNNIIKTEVKRLFKMKYNIELSDGQINPSNFTVEKLLIN